MGRGIPHFFKRKFWGGIAIVGSDGGTHKSFFNRDFDGSEEDAKCILARCMQLMQIAEDKIILEFYRDNTQTLDDGIIVTTDADVMGRSSGAAGTYRKEGGKAVIRINSGQLKNPESLVATISHELAHEKLLGENRIIENDEYLTDLTAIVFGFGVFIANAKFQLNSGINSGFGWQMQSQGYLPEQITAYAMASLALKKKETTYPYQEYLDALVAKYFEDSLAFLGSEENKKDTSVFWNLEVNDHVQNELHSSLSEEVKITFEPSQLKQLQQDLKHACYALDLETVENILLQGLSPDFTTIGGSPLAIAVSQGSKALIDGLLRYGADINYSEPEDIFDELPIMSACENENIAMVKYLISLGADVNRVSGNGKSVLEIAVETGNMELVGFLIENGARTEIKSGSSILAFDKTPICAAVNNNDTEMVSFLVKNGAKTKPIRKLARHEIDPKMVRFLKSKKYVYTESMEEVKILLVALVSFLSQENLPIAAKSAEIHIDRQNRQIRIQQHDLISVEQYKDIAKAGLDSLMCAKTLVADMAPLRLTHTSFYEEEGNLNATLFLQYDDEKELRKMSFYADDKGNLSYPYMDSFEYNLQTSRIDERYVRFEQGADVKFKMQGKQSFPEGTYSLLDDWKSRTASKHIDVADDFSVKDFRKLRRFILKKGVGRSFRSIENNNPYYQLNDLGCYLASTTERKLVHSVPLPIEKYNELVIWGKGQYSLYLFDEYVPNVNPYLERDKVYAIKPNHTDTPILMGYLRKLGKR